MSRPFVEDACSDGRIDVGTRYLAFFHRTAAGKLEWIGAAVSHSRAEESEVTELLRRVPEWSKAVGGISVIALPDKFSIAAGEDLTVGMMYRNVGRQPVTLAFRDWPEERMTHWTADVRHADGTRIAALPHPHVTRQEILDYFPKNTHTWEVTLRPGEIFTLPIDRFNTARGGWGYKERLAFRYYPLEKRGRYTIVLTDHNLFEQEHTAAPFEVEVQ